MNQKYNEQSEDEEKRKIRKRYEGGSMENAELIPAEPEPKLFDDDSYKRVAVYVRVSTLSKQQTSSFEMQQTHYADFVSRQEGWELVKIYTDEGLSGTSLKRREGFKQMIEDCKKGGIDLIVVKSVSRFSRNVVDGITSVDELKALNPPVGVYFENEGIYTLTNESEFALTLTQAVAQEESRVKSVSMNSSLKMRFSHGILLTPPLLGYDNDEDGNLIMNEDEADTVRLIFSMYQYGYSCNAIADTLTAFGRKTKIRNTKWSSHSILGILQNERHCGQVRTWKTFTPNYKTHNSKKNQGKREQYLYREHHAPIISPDDYIAVQKMIANAKYGGRNFMPVLRVNSGGALHGFVSVNPRWGSFNADDYGYASKSVGEGSRTKTPWGARKGEADLRGYEIARAQFFNSSEITSGSFYIRNAWFSGECIRKLGGSEYIELLIHPAEKLLAVRECPPEHRNAIRWAKLIDNKAYTRQFGGAAYLGTLFDILGWNDAWGYRLRSTVRNICGVPVAFFDTRETEVLIPRKILPVDSIYGEHVTDDIADNLYITMRSKYRVTAMPSAWRAGFGIPYYNKTMRNAQLDQAGMGTSADHNTEPDLHPTAQEALANTINQIIAKFQNREKQNGRSDNGTVL